MWYVLVGCNLFQTCYGTVHNSLIQSESPFKPTACIKPSERKKPRHIISNCMRPKGITWPSNPSAYGLTHSYWFTFHETKVQLHSEKSFLFTKATSLFICIGVSVVTFYQMCTVSYTTHGGNVPRVCFEWRTPTTYSQIWVTSSLWKRISPWHSESQPMPPLSTIVTRPNVQTYCLWLSEY